MNENGTGRRGGAFTVSEADVQAASSEQRQTFDAARATVRAIAAARAAKERRYKGKSPEWVRAELAKHESAVRELRALL